ncbi:THAP domain-containing protein 5, partial [Ophiophagus hannah]
MEDISREQDKGVGRGTRNAVGGMHPCFSCLFPLHSPERLRQWLSQMNQEKWAPTKHQHLCSDHFAPSCFEYRWGVRYLKPDAVPTIFQTSDSPLGGNELPRKDQEGEETRQFKSPFVKLEIY